MAYLSWIQAAVGLLLLLAWLILWRKQKMHSRHYLKSENRTLVIEWDPKARRRLLHTLFFGAALNFACAIAAVFLHDAIKLALFFGGILLVMIILFTLTHFAEKNNINRVKKESEP